MTTVTWNSPARGFQADVNGNSYYEFKSMVTIEGAVGLTTFSVLSGIIPVGTSLNIFTGTIEGYIENRGTTYLFTIRATNNGISADRLFAQKVLFNTTIVTWNSPVEGLQPILYEGQSYSFVPNVSVTNAIGQTSYAWLTGDIPLGTTYNANTGIISGILHYNGGSGPSYTFTLRAINNDAYSDRTFTQNVAKTEYSWYRPIDDNQGGFMGGQHYSMVPIISTTPDNQPLTWSIESGKIPAGTILNTTNGTVSGILINKDSEFSYTIVADILGKTIKKLFYGKVAMDVNINLDHATVEDFGAIGDGVTNDNAAFVAMLAATGGTIRMLRKEYLVNQLNITAYDQVTIIGEAMPQPNALLTKLENGSIFIGGIYVESNNVHVENFGLDFGTGRVVTAVDGIVLNAKLGELGNVAYVKSVSSLGIGGTLLSHGVLVQGYEYGTVQDVFSANHGYGVVVKSRNTIIDTIHIRNVIQAGVFIKGDSGISAGGVGNGSVVRVIVNNVVINLQSTNTVATGVWITPPTAPVSQVIVTNVHQVYGKTPVSVYSSGSVAGPYFANLVSANNIMSESAQYGFTIVGVTNNTQINNMTCINPLTGTAIYMDQLTSNYTINNINVIINNADITSDTCMAFYGSGSFDNITVTNTFRKMKLGLTYQNLPYIKTGVISGDCYIENEGTITGVINGAALSATDPAKIKIIPGSVIKLYGKFDLTSSTNKYFCNLPIYTGRDAVFSCAGIDSTDAVVNIAVRLNDFQLSIEPNLPSGFKSIDISNILIPR